jgi:putative FmdB family regulatory protein
MPTYEYRCNHCGHELEAFQSITADPLRRCPECSRKTLERLIGAGAGIIFKGSGFYVTDYKNSSSGASGRAGSSTSDSEKKPSEGDSESSSD